MVVNYLRISVTDRCNLKCIYCNPFGDCRFVESKEVLRFEEIQRIVRLFAECGINKIRLTGGEPLVRRNIVQLVRKLAIIRGLDDLALTTNGVLLESLAPQLKDAGLQRVNVSVDSADRESYKRITGFDLLPKVTKGIYKAIAVGLTPVKINSVIIRGVNDGDRQIAALAQMSIYLPVTVRFIEYCSTAKHTKPASDFVASSQVRRILEDKFGTLTPVIGKIGGGPSAYFRIKNAAGCVGFISGRSQFFCESCSRLRLTSDGKIKPCLYSDYCCDVKELIRGGATDRVVRDSLKKILDEKGNYTKSNSPAPEFSMQNIGG
jgi:cyclic pyranopterin phosphate synthase